MTSCRLPMDDGSCRKEVWGHQIWVGSAEGTCEGLGLTGVELDNAVGGSHGRGQENVLKTLEIHHRLFTASLVMIGTEGGSCAQFCEMVSRASNPAKQY